LDLSFLVLHLWYADVYIVVIQTVVMHVMVVIHVNRVPIVPMHAHVVLVHPSVGIVRSLHAHHLIYQTIVHHAPHVVVVDHRIVHVHHHVNVWKMHSQDVHYHNVTLVVVTVVMIVNVHHVHAHRYAMIVATNVVCRN
jgi:hypothetical protein